MDETPLICEEEKKKFLNNFLFISKNFETIV